MLNPVKTALAVRHSSSRRVRSRQHATLLAGAAVAVLSASDAIAQERILAVGDSIIQGTAGQCSMRLPLTKILQNDPSCDIEIVGSRLGPNRTPLNGNCTEADFTPHFAESGRRADFFEDLIGPEVQAEQPDYVILHVGSNDMFAGQTIPSTIDEIDAIITTIFQEKPTAVVLVGNIIPWDEEQSGMPGMSQRILDLGLAVEDLVESRVMQGDAVRLVDVRNGFDVQNMTVDGIHPNEAGERLMADRFLAEFQRLGVCRTFDIPVRTIADGEWTMISLPADPGRSNTVRDILGDDLPIGEMAIGSDDEGTWSLVELVYGQSGSPDDDRYNYLGPNSIMEPGVGYWIIQMGRASVELDMPDLALPNELVEADACASDSGCFGVPLNAEPGPLGFRYNLIGNPFIYDRPYDSVRATTDGGLCEQGCAPDQADSSNVVGNILWRYDGAASEWRQLTPGSTMNAWDGLFIPVLPGGDQLQPQLLFSAGD